MADIIPSQGYVGKIIESGTKEKQGAFYDKLYVGFLKGEGDLKWSNQYVYPIRDYAELHNSSVRSGFEIGDSRYSMRINGGEVYKAYPEINERIKTTVKFLSDKLPDVRSVFIIRGQKYLCEKITMTMSEKGRSKEMKGVFYRLK